MKVIITGAQGMLGHDVAAAADAVHHEVVSLGRSDLDICNRDAVMRCFERELPAAVVNCAAYTAVDLAESEADQAFAINGEAAGHVAAAAAAVGARVIYPSTDYVFDGTKDEPYVESDATNPLGVYGKSKLEGELQTAAANGRHTIMRTSWLFGTHGRNFVDTMLQLATKQNEVLVVRDQVGCPTYTRHLADAIVELLDYETLGVLHTAGAGQCSWWDFAVEIFRQAQVECKVLSSTTNMLDRPAPRPLFTAMVSERADAPILAPWDHGLHAFLMERAGLADIAGTTTTEA
ncbi:MAG: dTDP-4-dehydrorhamnose reductase [Thermoleophilaceae bacterium]|nr:dTDP-4-dehydrorhamnose reductase [Thermoleophilaceae bacterium]